MKKQLIKTNKEGDTFLYLHKKVYSFKKIVKSIKGIEGVSMDTLSNNYYRLALQTGRQKDVLEFCNFLFSEHR